jgi:hypothetical protein
MSLLMNIGSNTEKLGRLEESAINIGRNKMKAAIQQKEKQKTTLFPTPSQERMLLLLLNSQMSQLKLSVPLLNVGRIYWDLDIPSLDQFQNSLWSLFLCYTSPNSKSMVIDLTDQTYLFPLILGSIGLGIDFLALESLLISAITKIYVVKRRSAQDHLIILYKLFKIFVCVMGSHHVPKYGLENVNIQPLLP